jgi:hypothetical protein
MPVSQLTAWPTEADLEASIRAALRRAFPLLPEAAIRHQTKFAFSFGRARIEVDGTTVSRLEARADILLYLKDQPLAVLELKRNGVMLSQADEEQGLSYARMLHRRPPLVAITNGEDVRLLETHTGETWNPPQADEAEFKRLLAAASRAAAKDVKQAVSTLMGSSSDIWMQAIRQASASTIAELSGNWGEAQLPFVHAFLIPRKATAAIVHLLLQGSRLVTVEGPPLVGKSSVLRELVEWTSTTTTDLVVLFIEAESGAGVLQTIADLLRSALSWPVTREEARDWLVRLSNAGGPALVLALDGLGFERDDVRHDIEDLTSNAFGPSVRVVTTLDDVVAARLVLNSTGRQASAIGRRADRVRMGLLDNDEFAKAVEVLSANRMVMLQGAQSSEELRVPWVLRAAGARYGERPDSIDETFAGVIPPLLGLELIAHARERFIDHELRRLFRQTAEAVREDAQDRRRSVTLILQSLATFVVRRPTLRKFMEQAEIESLVARGFLKPFQPRSGDPVLVIRLPELLASEMADLLGTELAMRATGKPMEAANWLAGAAGSLPLGDVLAAQAILDAAICHGGLPLDLIVSLIETPPKLHTFHPGTKVAMYYRGIGKVEMTFRDGGAIAIESGGWRDVVDADPGEEEHAAYSDLHSWLILSHLAGRPFIMSSTSGDEEVRVDPVLLMEVGACAAVLRQPSGDPNATGFPTHELPHRISIVCHEAGIVEPITWSMVRYLSAEGAGAADWIEEAGQRQSLPLLARIEIALRHIAGSADPTKASWARHTLEMIVRPAFRDAFAALTARHTDDVGATAED